MENKNGNSQLKLLTVEEFCELTRMDKSTAYIYLSKTGARGGSKRLRLPDYLTLRIGKKVLFYEDKVIEWLRNGAEMVRPLEEE